MCHVYCAMFIRLVQNAKTLKCPAPQGCPCYIPLLVNAVCFFHITEHQMTILPHIAYIYVKGSMPPCIAMQCNANALAVWIYWHGCRERIFSERFKPHGNPLNSSHFDAPNTKFAPTGYRRVPNIISQHYKQELSAKASIIPKDRPIRFR